MQQHRLDGAAPGADLRVGGPVTLPANRPLPAVGGHRPTSRRSRARASRFMSSSSPPFVRMVERGQLPVGGLDHRPAGGRLHLEKPCSPPRSDRSWALVPRQTRFASFGLPPRHSVSVDLARRSGVLGQFDDVPIVVAIARRPSPALRPRSVDDVCSGIDRPAMSRVEVVHPKRDLRTSSGRAVLALVQREAHELTIGPTHGGMTAADPGVIALVIVEVEIEAEAIPIQPHGAIEVRHRKNDGHQALDVATHPPRLRS